LNPAASSQRTYNVLLVEDNEDDVWLTQKAFEKAAAAIELHVAYDGVDALRFLRGEPPHGNAPRPDLILIDLNMPRMDGHELLIELKRDEQLRVIPAIVVSTSAYDNDVYEAYSEHASAYLTKPLYHPASTHRTQALLDFWLADVAVLPPARPHRSFAPAAATSASSSA
jgi:CheY-like chemotaxis protein